MNVRTSTRASRTWPLAAAFLGLASLVITAPACSDDDAWGPGPQLAKFCQDLFASSAFSCCSAADRQDPQFGIRHRYADQANCEAKLHAQLSAMQGHAAFDGTAASKCLAHLAKGSSCGALPTADIQTAEDDAGCNSLLVGTQALGQTCSTSDECAKGLVCPPPKATGGSTCVKPAPINQACTGMQTTKDHPPCEEGLVCELIDQTSECPAPPCTNYQCVAFGLEGDPCLGLECKAGLACKNGTCTAGGAGAEGDSCRRIEHCGAGLYCDAATGTCAARKAAGEVCAIAGNATFECQGTCKESSGGQGEGTCAAFCSSR